MQFFLNQRFLFPVIIVVLVFLAFSPALQNQFTNLDDDTHIVENPKVQKLNLEIVRDIFTRDFDRTIPLTILSFSVEKHFFGLNSFVVHFNNILLHICVCILIYFLMIRLGFTKINALILVLLFGLHPTKVESVAWATERKDVLYAFFYLAAMHCHLSWIRRGESRYYWIAIILGLLSMMSKPAAISLPFVLLLIDYYEGRQWKDFSCEKIPYFIYIIPYALVTLTLYKAYSSESFIAGMLIWLWSLAFYVQKFIFPHFLVPIYIVPKPVVIFNPVYSFTILIVFVFVYLFWHFRKNREVVFASGLFLIPIIFALHNSDTTHINTVADRYLYLPCLGLCWLSLLVFTEIKKYLIAKNYANLFLILILGFCFVKTFNQSGVWYDNFSLWTHQVRFVPHESAYQNRGTAYYHEQKYPEAIDDFNKGLAINPNYIKLYVNRGLAYLPQGLISEAIEDFTKALSLDKDNITALNNRGAIYSKVNKYAEALQDFNHLLEINPNHAEALSNRGVLYTAMNDYDKALFDFNASIQINDKYAEAFYNRGGVYYRRQKWDLAWQDFNRAIELQPNYVKALYYRGILSYKHNDVTGALKDLSEAVRLSPVYVDAYISRGTILAKLNKKDEALKDFNKALEINPQNRQAIIEKQKVLKSQ